MRSLLLLLALGGLVMAAVVKLPLTNHRVSLAEARAAKAAAKLNAKDRINPKHQSFIQSNYKGDYFTTTLTLGSPAQPFLVAVESGSTLLWVLDQYAVSSSTGQKYYDPSASTTSSQLDSQFTLQDGTFYIGSGDHYNDTMRFNQVKTYQAFGLADYVYDMYGNSLPVDGVIGLNWSPPDDRKKSANDAVYPSPIDNLMKLTDTQMFTIWLDSISSTDKKRANTNEGMITLGGYDEDNCDTDVTFVPLTPHVGAVSLYTFKVKNIAYDQYTHRGSYVTYTDTGSSAIALPDGPFQAINKAISPDYDYDLDVYTIDCSTRTALPDLIFTIGDGVTYNVPYQHYTLDVDGSGQTCIVAIAANNNPYDRDLLLGNPFLRAYCTTFDYAGQQIGFSTSLSN